MDKSFDYFIYSFFLLIENAISSLAILCRITPDLAKELIQPIGDRIVFLEKIAQIKAVEYIDKVQLAQVCLNYIHYS